MFVEHNYFNQPKDRERRNSIKREITALLLSVIVKLLLFTINIELFVIYASVNCTLTKNVITIFDIFS